MEKITKVDEEGKEYEVEEPAIERDLSGAPKK